MRSVEFLLVFAVTALHFAVVAGCVRPNEFVPDTEFRKDFLKECSTVGFGTVEPVGIIRTVVGLNTHNGIRKFLNDMTKKDTGRIGTVFLKGFKITETGILIDDKVFS